MNNERIIAVRSLRETRLGEHAALRRYETARHQLEKLRDTADELGALHVAQTSREQWLKEHPSELRWAKALQELLSSLQRDPPTDHAESMTESPGSVHLATTKTVVGERRVDALSADPIEHPIGRRIPQRDMDFAFDETHVVNLEREASGPTMGL